MYVHVCHAGSARFVGPEWTAGDARISSENFTKTPKHCQLVQLRLKYRAWKVITVNKGAKVFVDHQDPLVEEAPKELTDRRGKG